MASYMTNSYMAGTTISRHVGELEPLTTEQYMAWKGNQQLEGMFMKLSMARSSSLGAWITRKSHGKTELHVNRLTATSFSNFGARYEQSTASYKCNQGHGWIAHNHMYKTSLLKYLKISMDLSVASSLHGIKITESV